jgi:hypothetical protein
MIRRLVIVAAAAGAAGYAAWKLRGEPWYREWGHETDEAVVTLPGDDLIADPTAIDTRGIDIAAPPEVVWPWLVQMGYGRGGWYSYDQMDMKGASSTAIEPELQHLDVGDVVPTHPGGGFVVRAIEPGRSLVLWVDRATIEAQAAAAEAAGEGMDSAPANLKATGAVLDLSSAPEFEASWAFVLEPRDDGRSTRLIERFRARMVGGGHGAKLGAPFLGFGVFVMMRKQLLGIRDRAESGPDAPGSEEPAELLPA